MHDLLYENQQRLEDVQAFAEDLAKGAHMGLCAKTS
jgi:hypothetical protein